jgi:multidrug efflux pump
MVFEILRITVKTPILQIAPETDRLPVQFVIGTTESYERMNQASQALMDKALRSGTFAYMDTDLKIDKPQTTIEIDRDKAAQLGLTMRDIGDALASMLSRGYVNYFSLAGRSCKVIPQVMQRDRLNAGQLRNYYINTAGGHLFPFQPLCASEQT